MTKRVWILGAGFSAGLGGPLLPDLLSMRSWQSLRLAWRDPFQARSQELSLAYHLYHYGRGYPEGYCLDPFKSDGSHRGENYFRDAEDYLSWLDVDSEGRYANLVQRWWAARSMMDTPMPVEAALLKDVRREAKRIIAAECELFLKEAAESALGPYRRWAAKLTPDDAIITFNYDRVVEAVRPSTINVVGAGEEPRPDYPRLFKMHGSVDWTQKDGTITRMIGKSAVQDALAIPRYDPVMGMPGRSKDQQTATTFDKVWIQAGKALQDATSIHVIGYRIPESDPLSRDWLLKHLRRNKNPVVKMTLTLGSPGFDTDRLEAMLRMALRGRLAPTVPGSLRPRVLKMWAQDHLDSFAYGEGLEG